MAEGSASLAARWMAAGEWRAHPGRVVTAALAIAIGVALGFAVHLINASALNEFGRAVRAVNGEADLRVRAVSPGGFDERLYPRLARAGGVAAASPVVELKAAAPGGVSLTLVGLDALRAAQVTPSLASGGRVAGVFGADGVLVSPALMAKSRAKIGSTLALSANGRTHAFRVAGALPGAGDGQNLAVIDIAEAQWRFGRLGRIDRVDLRLAEGADATRVRSAITAMLPADAQLADSRSDARASDNLSRAYRVNLDMLALMALLTGGFLVYSAQSLSVARRRTQFALLRVLGSTRRALLAQVLTEGLIVGTVGAALGLALGLGLARGALQVFGGDLGGGYFSGERPDLVFAPLAAAVFFALGVAASLVGSLIPAREAGRAPPAVALKNLGDAVDPNRRPTARIALAALALGAGAAFLPAVGGLPVFGYVSMALLLVGGVAAMPWLARALLAPLQRLNLGAPPLDLAVKRLWGAPSQASVALAGVVASTSLMIAMAVMVASFRGSVEDWLNQYLPADIYIRVEDGDGGLTPAEQARLAATPGVGRVEFLQMTPLRLDAERPPVLLIARPHGWGDAADSLAVGRLIQPPPGALPVWVSEPYARLYGKHVGETIDLPIGPGGRTRATIVGVWRDYARQSGAITMRADDFQRLTGDETRADAAVYLRPGARLDATLSALEAAAPDRLAGRIQFAQPRQLREMALRLFDRSFAVTYLLEAIAILVGLAGVAATISAQTLARTKEFGMLRHLGVGRGQIVAMLASEGALLGGVGGVAGIGLGLVMSQVLIHVVNPQSFNWTMQTRLPWTLLASVGAALVAAAAGAALVAGRRALSADAVRAVREDW
ncbi:FtsX-like permease family protein [Phenylobacterium sp.]|uniref:FtsX-like permease family protein n=1 Tax=Phenylobacterium sp. TaxID=1871053 RepID=UPI0035B2EDF7